LNLFEEICSPKTLRGISERTISAFVAGLRLRPGYGKELMAASSIKIRLQFLHTVLQWAVGQKYLPECPKFPVVKVDEVDPEPVPEEVFERLLERAPDQNMTVFLLSAWLAGLRLGEALDLEWEESEKVPWIDFRRRRIVLPARSVKGRKHQWVPLDPLLQEQLEALPRCGRKVFHFEDKKGRPIKLVAVSHRVVTLAQKAGVKLSMKSLRRGFGCRYAGKVPAQVLQRLLRHSNIRVTMKYYANIDEAVEQAIFGNAVPLHTNLHISRPAEG
jgi:integrase